MCLHYSFLVIVDDYEMKFWVVTIYGSVHLSVYGLDSKVIIFKGYSVKLSMATMYGYTC